MGRWAKVESRLAKDVHGSLSQSGDGQNVARALFAVGSHTCDPAAAQASAGSQVCDTCARSQRWGARRAPPAGLIISTRLAHCSTFAEARHAAKQKRVSCSCIEKSPAAAY